MSVDSEKDLPIHTEDVGNGYEARVHQEVVEDAIPAEKLAQDVLLVDGAFVLVLMYQINDRTMKSSRVRYNAPGAGR